MLESYKEEAEEEAGHTSQESTRRARPQMLTTSVYSSFSESFRPRINNSKRFKTISPKDKAKKIPKIIIWPEMAYL